MPAEVCVSNHPLLLHQLTLLRERTTESPLFRQLVAEMSRLLFYEATRDLPLRSRPVQSPLAETTGQELAAAVALVPILRAGLGMAEALVPVIPTAQVWHLGLYRDHDTHLPVRYYCKPPLQRNVGVALLVDPMLATGGSAVAAVDILKEWGVQRIKYLGLIAAPEGVQAMQKAHPDVPLHLGAVDSHLNELAYIVPGLGDAGDRQFGTS